MEKSAYCVATSEPQANEILTHLRNLGFSSSEISILLKESDTRNISVKEDAVRGAQKGTIAGSIAGVLFTALTVPALGPLSVAGPILSALGGGVAGGVIGGLAGGSGALTRIGIPDDVCPGLEQKLHDGGILIAVHTPDAARLEHAMRVFRSSGGEMICEAEDRAA
jgi:hypothetical protein